MLFVLALSAYVTGFFGYLGYLIFHQEIYHKVGHYFFVLGLGIQTFVLLSSFMVTGIMPVENLRETLCFTAWAIALIYVGFNLRFRLMVLGAFVAPLVCGIMIASSLFSGSSAVSPDLLKGVWTFVHITAIFLGDGAFILAACVGIIYLMQERAIKKKQHGFIYHRLPSLEVLDKMGYACVAFGFPMLTFGMIAGFIYAQSVWGKWWSWDPKELWSVVTWLFYAALLHERLTVGWRGKRAAVMAIIGLAVVLITFGVNFFLLGHHTQFTKF
ncbi:c-type cytochrome biogenesis protein CcsB [Desulfatibacillum aliphaticivorans]|uniref:c-type cytochrome biogenesis protein CcsB n=1 Tax=Desulfatibacillum aliphaticivorans TaxID=218208 RepID=UPI000417E052|nr:c-type cytochrome biogenesis protein CcsB [Desulfatibacillum aliphaticivorans]